MNKRHLALTVVAILALSSSTIASAEGRSHTRVGNFHHAQSITPISLGNGGGVLTIDTSTAVPSFVFDTSTAVPSFVFDTSTAVPSFVFDTSTATTDFGDDVVIRDGEHGHSNSLGDINESPKTPSAHSEDSEESALPPVLPGNTASPAIPPASPVAPGAPSWIKKPHAKSNDENQNQNQILEDSQD